MVTTNRAGRAPYIQPLLRFGLEVMSMGFLVSDTQTIMPDPLAAGQVIHQTFGDVKWGNLDYLLVDFPPGSGEPQSTLVQGIKIDGAIIVTTPQELSLIDASRSIGMFQKANVPLLGVVENMSYLVCPHCGKSVDVFQRSNREWPIQNYQVAQLGKLPMDAVISLPVNETHPLITGEDAPVFQIFQDMAAKIIDQYPV
jgi:ATP-binding protein involved in chromosome partitioning